MVIFYVKRIRAKKMTINEVPENGAMRLEKHWRINICSFQ